LNKKTVLEEGRGYLCENGKKNRDSKKAGAGTRILTGDCDSSLHRQAVSYTVSVGNKKIKRKKNTKKKEKNKEKK